MQHLSWTHDFCCPDCKGPHFGSSSKDGDTVYYCHGREVPIYRHGCPMPWPGCGWSGPVGECFTVPKEELPECSAVEIKAGSELDRAVAEVVGEVYANEPPEGFVGMWDSWGPELPAFSADLNAAFAAAEKVDLLREGYLHRDTYWHVWSRPTGDLGSGFDVRGDTPALAICAAILKLKEKSCAPTTR